MKSIIAKYKVYIKAGYSEKQLREMILLENLTKHEQEFVLATIFKKTT